MVLLNLMQQDTKVLRVTFRLAWVAANPVTLQAPTRTASYPASVLTQGTFVGALGVEQALFGATEEQKALGGDGRTALPAERETAEEEVGRRTQPQRETTRTGDARATTGR